jgi:hypothetical protein
MRAFGITALLHRDQTHNSFRDTTYIEADSEEEAIELYEKMHQGLYKIVDKNNPETFYMLEIEIITKDDEIE